MRRSFLFIALVLLAAACSAAPAVTPPPDGVRLVDPPIKISDYPLINQSGQAARISDFNGKLTLLAFGYTHCPDVCPITLAHFKQVKAELGDKAAQVNFVFISVDGARDTPERLKQYLSVFDPSFVGLSGDDAILHKVIAEYNGQFILDNAGGTKADYTVQHTAGSFLVDGKGEWSRQYAYALDPKIIAQDIQRVLLRGG
jgi:protein SCO1/2